MTASVFRCSTMLIFMWACANIGSTAAGDQAVESDGHSPAMAVTAANNASSLQDLVDIVDLPAIDELTEPSITTIEWEHSTILDQPDDDTYHLFWTPRSRDIVFRVEVRTTGYIGFGLSKNGRMAGADIVIGWVDLDGQPYLQDRHGTTSHSEPILDKKQNYHLLSGFENETHTVLVFKRKYDTCDKHDLKITNDTYRVIYAYDDRDPELGTDGVATIPRAHGRRHRGTKSILLTQHVVKPARLRPHGVNEFDHVFTWDLLSNQVSLPEDDDTLYWCKLFKLPVEIKHKHHVIGLEPVIQPGNDGYMHHVLIYECLSRISGDGDEELERLAGTTDGQLCYEPTIPGVLKSCDKLIGVWTVGSEGFFMPADMGYPLDPQAGVKYLMMEIHYDNPYLQGDVRDSSGIRLFYTPNLRPVEAGLLSIGIDPNWKHLIPPKQTATISYGHCIGKCTEKAFPVDGINVFAAVLHSHSIGKKMQLRHVRGDTELPPIAVDNNYDVEYQEYRIFKVPYKVLPGDHLIAECTYNSRGLDRMTQGGFTTREEMCLMFIYYYPLMDMSLCHSLPTLSTVYASVGVKEVSRDRIPAVIKSPVKFANRSLAEHIAKYDWTKNLKLFRDVTRTGSFEITCSKHRQTPLLESEPHYYPNITHPYREPKSCVSGRHGATSQPDGRGNSDNVDEHGNNKEHRGTTTTTSKAITTTDDAPSMAWPLNNRDENITSDKDDDDIQRKTTSRVSPRSTTSSSSSRDVATTSQTLVSVITFVSLTSLVRT